MKLNIYTNLTEFQSNKVPTESLNESITPLAHTTYNSIVTMSMAHAQYFRDRKMRCRIPVKVPPNGSERTVTK